MANPLPEPQASISELFFPDQDKWILELDISGGYVYESWMFDSVCISSKSGTAKIKLSVFQEGQSIFLVTRDSLLDTLSIDPSGDFIKIITYESFWGFDEPLIDSLIFGDYPGATVSAIQNGFSVCRPPPYRSFFAKDKSPTIGLPNDTSGTCGTLKGYMYDIENEQISEGEFWFDNKLFFNADGQFHTRVFAHKTEIISIYNIDNHFIRIDTLKLDVEPDSTYFRDIHLQIDYSVDIISQEKLPDAGLLFRNYPNPFNSTTTFLLNLPPDLKNKGSSIIIYNIQGQLINKIDFNASNRILWHGENKQGVIQASGIYFYTLVLDNIIKKSGSVILLK